MTIADVGRLAQWVLWLAFGVSMAFGAIVQRTGFCTMGAVSDAIVLGDWTRMRQWALAAGVAIAGFAILSGLGMLSAPQTLYASTRWMWLSALAGGLVFGFGMVLGSGCASKNLVRVGGGSLKALVVTLVIGVAGFATLKGITAVLRAGTVDRAFIEMAGNADLGGSLARATGMGPSSAALATGLGLAAVFLAWAVSSPANRKGTPLLAGVGVGATVLGMWCVMASVAHVPEHPETLQDTFLATATLRAEALSFVSPVAYTLDWLLFYSDTSKRLTVGIVSVLGVVCGSAAMALAQRSFRWEGFAGREDLALHLVGATLMGIGGVTAMGCTIGQGLSGLSTLSLTSVVALPSMLLGAWAGVTYQAWRIERIA